MKGQKIFITWGEHDFTPNIIHLVLARIDEAKASGAELVLGGAPLEDIAAMMRSVVTNGTASSGQISGIKVGAKTGTAESGTDALPHAWFVATGEYKGRSIVVAVVVENGGGEQEVSGNRIAGPIAAAVLETAFKQGN